MIKWFLKNVILTSQMAEFGVPSSQGPLYQPNLKNKPKTNLEKKKKYYPRKN
jgi:hypothetical protein